MEESSCLKKNFSQPVHSLSVFAQLTRLSLGYQQQQILKASRATPGHDDSGPDTGFALRMACPRCNHLQALTKSAGEHSPPSTCLPLLDPLCRSHLRYRD